MKNVEYAVNVYSNETFVEQLDVFSDVSEAKIFASSYENNLESDDHIEIVMILYDKDGNEINVEKVWEENKMYKNNICGNCSFINDKEKMADFKVLTKEEFLESYSYLTEEEYELTVQEYKKRIALKNLILLLFTDSLEEWESINDDEFVHYVCKNAGITRNEYVAIMEI